MFFCVQLHPEHINFRLNYSITINYHFTKHYSQKLIRFDSWVFGIGYLPLLVTLYINYYQDLGYLPWWLHHVASMVGTLEATSLVAFNVCLSACERSGEVRQTMRCQMLFEGWENSGSGHFARHPRHPMKRIHVCNGLNS